MTVLKFVIILAPSLWVFNVRAQLNTGGETQAGGVHFEQALSWTEAQAMAKSDGKYIFVDAYATWCGPCRLMDQEAYPNDTVAAMMNRNFVSVKVQMDSSTKDRESVIRWYGDARDIRIKYGITAYPTLLFFNSDGALVYKHLGYNGVSQFLKTIHKALDPLNVKYFSMLEAYKKGDEDDLVTDSLASYAASLGEDSLAGEIARNFVNRVDRHTLMTPARILFVLKVARNRRLADSLFNLYRTAILNSLSDQEFLTAKSAVYLSATFSKLMSSADRFFRLCYREPRGIDSILGYPRAAGMMVDSTITREEVSQKLNAVRGAVPDPAWAELAAGIARKYPGVEAKRLVMDFEIRYYKARRDSSIYLDVLIGRVQKYGPYGIVPDEDFNLNNLAWEVFHRTSDTNKLKIALSWSDRAVHIVSEGKDRENLANWMDTNANIRYRLGRREEAIKEETEALRLDPKASDIEANLHKMTFGEPTWSTN
jgi:thioredoxin-related protein